MSETGRSAPLRHQNLPLTSIRGVAALWVVGHHLSFFLGFDGYAFAKPFFAPGDSAVDIFFVLSGFVMTAVHRDLARGEEGNFLLRRVFRIYPLHLTVLAAVVSLALWNLMLYGSAPANPWGEIPIVAVLAQPIVIHGPSWCVMSWSLSVEMACYLLFPLAVRLVRSLELVGTGLVLLALCVIEWNLRSGNFWGWMAFERGVAGFALGMVVQQMATLLPRFGPGRASLLEIIAVSGIVFALRYIETGIQDVPLFAALLILALASDNGIVARLLGARVFVWLGKISFSVYLIHGPLLFYAFGRLPPSRLPFAHEMQAIVFSAGVLAILCALSTLTWRYVEEPGRRFGSGLARRRRVAGNLERA